ncbi:GNAT family N-acetyltransferase [Streptomyces sp. NPDC007088]|uniref:GNAT family N-acetyltransferase n=1 Tax=Streptomyces sp. NPDC007088 TaxID=3364773 RepID=UPI0036A33B32
MDISVQNYAVAHLRRRPVTVETGGFVAGFDPATTSPAVNYATVLPGSRPGPADVAALIAAFRERGLLPRLEFAPGTAPAAEPALRAAGFTTEEEHVYLVCTPGTLTASSNQAGPVVEVPRTDAEFVAIDAALCAAFGNVFPASAEGAARLRRTEEEGGAVRFVRAPDGGVAGGAGVSAPAVGTCELWGVGTRPGFRGRGIASAVTAALTRTVFGRGAESVWLEYSGDGSRRVYERLGFRPRGNRLYLTLGEAPQG